MTDQNTSLGALTALLSKHDITAPVDWSGVKTREGSQWFIGKSWEFEGKTFYEAHFGDFKADTKITWQSWGEGSSKAEAKAAEEHSTQLLESAAKAKLEAQMQAAVDSEFEFKKFATSGRTPYMDRKLIKELYGARIKDNSPHSPILCVPLRDVEGTFWNYQRILSEKLSAGDKFMFEGARIEGCFHCLSTDFETLASIPDGTKIYVCEGFATAASVQEAFPKNIVVSAFNSGNLLPVCTAIKERFPNCAITVCADNDAYTMRYGKPYNAGLVAGRRAAGAVKGKCVWPVFKYPQKGLTDFNDLVPDSGKDAVKDQIENHASYVKGIQPMCLAPTKGKQKPPTQKDLVEYMLEYFQGRMIRQDKSIFTYNGKHWTEQDVMGVDRLKQMIQVAANGLLDSRDMESYYKYLLIDCPQVPHGINFYQPNPYAANFQNGTLHIEDKSLVFRKHDPTDYLTSVLPFDCGPEGAMPPAPRLDRMLNRLFEGREDKAEAIQLAHELIGACFMPAFPVIVIFYGRPLSGKSTLIKFLVKLVSQDNVSNVQLCDMHGFNMETMIGKLINYDTDIDVNRPMIDSEVKKITDRVPRTVRRKGLRDASAYLPAVHLFAGNSLPKSLDGASHAYDRRIILVHTDNAITETPEEDFEQKILDEEMAGVVARGMAGLRRRLERGKYTISEQSRERVKAMEDDSDLVGQFFEEAFRGELDDNKKCLVLEPDAPAENWVARPQLWTIFKHWQDDAIQGRSALVSRNAFFQRVESKGYTVSKQSGIWRVNGLRLGGPVGVG